ncbi:MAG: MFS transporter, partial [Chloroflexota bacterium]
IGLGSIFFIDFATFLIGILTIFLVDIPSPQPDTSLIEEPKFIEEFTAGFRYLWVHRPFLYLTGYITLMVFTLGAYYALYPPLILSLASDSVLGIVNALVGVGSLIGAILLGIWKFKKRVRVILLAGILMSLGGMFAGMQPTLFLIVPGLVLAFGTVPFLIGLNRALYQLKAPPALLGRIFAFRLAVGTGAQTIGALLAGFIAENVFKPVSVDTLGAGQGIAFTLLLFGWLFLITTLIAFTIAPLRQLEQRLPDFQEDDRQAP